MNTLLSNSLFDVTINSKGAELISVFSKEHTIEYMWNGEKELWPRHAPNLFPVVGKLKGNRFSYEGKTYEMPQHGFARDHEFQLLHAGEVSASFMLHSSAETLKIFPFNFELFVDYLLKNNSLEIHYKVVNPSDEKIYFSLGAHPGFSCKISNANSLDDFFLEFEKEENTSRYYVREGLISDRTEKFSTIEKRFPLNKNIFSSDAIVLKKLNSDSVRLLNKKNPHGLELGWGKEFSYFGIWTKAGSDKFVCLEPWAGIADGIDFSGDFSEKEGIIDLDPAEKKEFKLRISFF